MTKQEAGAYEARMSRVWSPFKRVISRFGNNKRGTFGVFVTEDVALFVDLSDLGHEPSFEMRGPGHDSQAAGLRYDDEEVIDRCRCEEQEEFTNKWLSYFRRGLWLSGIPIEASAHEKAEWIQGFSREEIDAWNLKI